MENEPIVSIIIPTYRRGDKLKKAIESVFLQTYDNIEIVIVDDNNDEYYRNQTTLIEDSYKNNPNIKFVYNTKNVGPGLSRNEGVTNASGHYIAFLDDDDLFLSNKIQNQVIFMIKNSLDFCLSNILLVNKDNKIVDIKKHANINGYTNEKIMSEHLMNNLTGTPSFMIKKTTFIESGMFKDMKIGEEFHLVYSIIQIGAKIGYYDKFDVLALVDETDYGLTSGDHKLNGEKELLAFKLSKSNLLSRKQIRYVKMRSKLVVANYHLKRREIILFLNNMVLSSLYSPVYFVKVGFDKVKSKKDLQA